MLIEGNSSLTELTPYQPTDLSANPSAQTGNVAQPVLSGPTLPSSGGSRYLDNISHFNDWYILSETQSLLAESQASELSLLTLSQQLGTLQNSLNKLPTEQLALQLRLLDQQITSQGLLDNTLNPAVLQNSRTQQSYVLDKIDLLAQRPKDEQVSFFFRDTRSSVTVNLPANASKPELFHRLQSALLREGIQLRLNNSGQLELSVATSDKQRLERPVSVSGEGYRIPAGNPVAVKLIPIPGVLSQLAEQLLALTAGKMPVFSNEINALQKRLRDRIGLLRKYRRKLLGDLDDHAFDIASDETTDEITELQKNIAELLGSDSYRAVNNNLSAQANLSKKNVIAMLSD